MSQTVSSSRVTEYEGRLWSEYWISCARCDQCDSLEEASRRAALRVATQRGWRVRPRVGIVCPECAHAGDAELQ